MPIASGQYWNAVHGNTPEEVKQDIQSRFKWLFVDEQMRDLARSMSWMLNNLKDSKTPEREEKTFFNFIH